MKELEICKPSKCKQLGLNFWVLFNKKNHRCNNRKATYQELRKALDNWTINEIIEPECKVYIYPDKDKEILLEKALLTRESKENKKVICVLGQDWDNNYLTTGICLWNKIIFYDSKEEQYYLRSFASQNIRTADNKLLDNSKVAGWYIDLSTLGAPSQFWEYLKDNLKEEPKVAPLSVKKEEYKFWHHVHSIQTREQFIECLKHNLTDEEIIDLWASR
tara:strand:+ start:920 stop:1573 length:654 start_codon:yes stop_codon:yes gene_type:complete